MYNSHWFLVVNTLCLHDISAISWNLQGFCTAASLGMKQHLLSGLLARKGREAAFQRNKGEGNLIPGASVSNMESSHRKNGEKVAHGHSLHQII